MINEMKITGVAPQIASLTFAYLIIAAIIDSLNSPLFNITNESAATLAIAGIILIVLGAAMVLYCGRKLLKSFKNDKLMTDGLYKIFRNPMYAAYLLFIIPGICLILNSWLVLSTILVNYILFKILIQKEYKYLEEKFGDAYKKYLSAVWLKFL